ncbi:MAG TPA: PrsW family intramembrane metalloprotease [Chloroflexi bacterium]|nr:PrsW family intramembrane metalloprotease [Chloroflexota bacterium]
MGALLAFFSILAIGILPMVVYALILWWFDRYEKEPVGLLLAAFLWGAIPAVIFSLIVELVLDIPISHFVAPGMADAVSVTVVAPIAEEIFKGLAVFLLLLLFQHELDSPLDGIIYGGLVGFGFAAVENIFYLGSAFLTSGVAALAFLTVVRVFLFGLNHALFTGLTGLGVALARTSPRLGVKIAAPPAGLLLGIAAHSVHNLSVTLAATLVWPCLIAILFGWGGVLFLFIVIVWASARERQWIVTFLADEIEKGTLSQRDYDVVCSYTRRLDERAKALTAGDFRRWWNLGCYYRLATKLAFDKRHLMLLSNENEKVARSRVAQLRQQVVELGDRF